MSTSLKAQFYVTLTTWFKRIFTLKLPAKTAHEYCVMSVLWLTFTDTLPKIEISPIYSSHNCQWRSWWHCLININILEFHGGKKFHPIRPSRQCLWPRTQQPQMINMPSCCLCGITQSFRRFSSPICLKTMVLTLCLFSVKVSTVANTWVPVSLVSMARCGST